MERKLLSLFMLSLLSLVLFSNINAQDDPLKWFHPKTQGNTVRGVQAIDVNTWYGVTLGGTFIKTTNSGTTWTEIRGEFLDQTNGDYSGLYDLHFFDANTGIVVGIDGTIARTTDAGETWDKTIAIPGATSTWYDVFFMNSMTGFVTGTTTNDFGKTTDGGMTWTSTGASIPTTFYSIYAMTEDTIFCTGTSGRIFKSEDGGATFSELIDFGTATMYCINFFDNNLGVATGSSNTVQFTTDGGATWTENTTGLPTGTIWYDIDFNMTPGGLNVYVTGDELDLYRINSDSLINARTWNPRDFKESPDQYANTMYSTDLVGTDSLITAGYGGIFNKRYTGGDVEAFLQGRIMINALYDVWASPSQDTVIASGSSGVILYTIDAGASFDSIDVPVVSTQYGLSMMNGSTGYISASSGKILKTTTGPSGFTEILDLGSMTLYDIQFIDENTGWVFGSSSTVQKTTDGGTTWTPQTPAGSGTTVYGAHMLDANTGFLVGSSGKVNKTTDGGDTWTDVGPAGTQTLYGVFMATQLTGYVAGLNGSFYQTTDGGTTWNQVTLPFPEMDLRGVHFISPLNGMAVGSGGEALKTSDGGLTWSYFNTSAGTQYSVRMVANDTAYIPASFGNLMKYATFLTDGTFSGTNVPREYYLSQNYPNPFNPETRIQFGIPNAANISLKVFDISGREVATLFNNRKVSAGTFDVRFDGSNLSSGVYFYSLSVDGNLVDSKKMMLLK